MLADTKKVQGNSFQNLIPLLIFKYNLLSVSIHILLWRRVGEPVNFSTGSGSLFFFNRLRLLIFFNRLRVLLVLTGSGSLIVFF